MALTTQQQAAFKAAIEAAGYHQTYPNNADGGFAIAAIYNAIANPEFVVWKTRVTRQEVLQNGFDWTRLDNLSVGKARVWSEIFVDGALNAAKPNVRTGIESVWVGTAQDLAVRAAVYVHCKRPATVAEKLFATGTGTTESPATMTFEGAITFQDVLTSMGW